MDREVHLLPGDADDVSVAERQGDGLGPFIREGGCQIVVCCNATNDLIRGAQHCARLAIQHDRVPTGDDLLAAEDPIHLQFTAGRISQPLLVQRVESFDHGF